MKVRVAYTVEVDERFLRMLACMQGRHGRLATRVSVVRHFQRYGSSLNDDLSREYDHCEDCRMQRGGL